MADGFTILVSRKDLVVGTFCNAARHHVR
jgi:hypothetical protein